MINNGVIKLDRVTCYMLSVNTQQLDAARKFRMSVSFWDLMITNGVIKLDRVTCYKWIHNN